MWAPIALTAATAAMIGGALVPAFGELRRRGDAGPLPTRNDDGEIRSFAEAFRRRIQPAIGGADPGGTFTLTNGDEVLRVKNSDTLPTFGRKTTALALLQSAASLAAGLELDRDLYAAGDIYVGNGTLLRALLAAGDATLASDCVVCRWLHADGAAIFGRGCGLFGRASANRELSLSTDCRFERITAPLVRFVDHLGAGEVPEPPLPPALVRRSIVDVKLGRLLVNGDFHLASGDVLQGHVVASGSVRIGEGSRIFGSLKSHGQTEIGRNTEVHGAVVSSGTLHIAGDSFLGGPVLAEGELTIGPGTLVGLPQSPASVSAPRITVSPGAAVHGSLWAREEGQVCAITSTASNSSRIPA